MRVHNVRAAQSTVAGQAEFSNEVQTNIVIPGTMMSDESWTDVTRVWPCYLKYRIDLEYRSWGVKGATLTLDSNPITVNAEIKTETNQKVTEESKIITIDPSKIRVELSPGSGIFLAELDVHLNPDFTVDYSSSEIRGFTLMRGEE